MLVQVELQHEPQAVVLGQVELQVVLGQVELQDVQAQAQQVAGAKSVDLHGLEQVELQDGPESVDLGLEQVEFQDVELQRGEPGLDAALEVQAPQAAD